MEEIADRPSQEVLVDRLEGVIDMVKDEWDLTYVDILGALDVVRAVVIREMYEAFDEEE